MLNFMRKTSTPNPPRKISSQESGKTLELNKDDIKCIVTSWREVKNKQALGVEIFSRILHEKPQLKALFGLASLRTEDHAQLDTAMRLSPRVRSHADKLVAFLSRVIDSLHEDEKLVVMVREIGLLHCRFRHVTFEAQYWLLFKMTFLDCICHTDSLSDKYFIAWNKLLMFVISEMKDAFNTGIRRNTWPDEEL